MTKEGQIASQADEQHIPSSSEIAILERQVAAETTSKYPDLGELASDVIAAFPAAFSIIDSPDRKLPLQDIVVVMFATKAHFTIRCGSDLSMKGYYAQAQVLNRLLIQEYMLARYYHCHPDKASEYLNKDDVRTPGMSKVLKSLELEHLYKDYGQLSEQEHSRLYSTWTTAVDAESRTGLRLRSAPVYDRELFLQCLEFWAKYATAFLRFLAQVFPPLFENSEFVTRVADLLERTNKFLDQRERNVAAMLQATSSAQSVTG